MIWRSATYLWRGDFRPFVILLVMKNNTRNSTLLVGLPYDQLLLHLAFWKPQSFFAVLIC